jgi:CelD/BcsL family acetyltransferase involved in cellulose biosynthesis
MGLSVQREELGALEQDWRHLVRACPNGRPFLSPTWLRCWWESFGSGREMVLLSVRDAGRLVGIAPLMRDGASLTFAGNTKVCDYMDFPSEPGREPEVLEAVFRALGEGPWDEVKLWAMREDSPSLPVLSAVAGAFGLEVQCEVEDVCPNVEMPADWDLYTASLERKHRHELKRKLRKLSQAGEPALELLQSPDAIEAAMDTFLWMHRESRSDKAAFMTGEMEAFFRRLIPALAADGLAEMAFLTLSGKRAAGVVCFRHGDEMLLYNSGYNPAYAAFSVGLLSKVLAMQYALGSGIRHFDFLRGPERYKYELGAKDLAVHRVTVRRTGP